MRFADLLGDGILMTVLGASFMIPLGMALYKVVHGLANLLRHQQKVKKAVEKAEAARPAEKPPPTFVRHDDVVELTPEQQRQKAQAIELVQQGKAKEAAIIFRMLTLDRLAIQTLEDAGYYKEACAILFEKKLPNRAAFLYLRHNLFFEAAESFLIAKMFTDAGNAFLKAAAKDYRYFRQAAEAYEAGNQIGEAIFCYETILDLEHAMTLCLRSRDFKRGIGLAVSPHFPLPLLKRIDAAGWYKIVGEIELNPKVAQDLGVVAARAGVAIDFRFVTKRFGVDKLLHRSFVVGSGGVGVEGWADALALNGEPWEIPAFIALADALREVGLQRPAGRLYEIVGRKVEAIRCYLASGHVERVRVVLGEKGASIAAEIEGCLERYQKAIHGAEASTAGARFWDDVNSILARVAL